MADEYATGTYPGDLTVDDGGPRRGSLQDFGGATVEDEDPAPDKNTMLYADLVNGVQRAVAAHEKCVMTLGISVTFDGGGTPVVSQVTGGPEAATIVTITPTDNGDGDTTLSWPAGTFAASLLGPMPGLNDGTVGGGITAALVANGVRVKTWTGASTPANRAFTVVIH